jgi:hypothetical protein
VRWTSDRLEILALRPTVRDLGKRHVAFWRSGHFGAGEPLKDVAAEIVAVLAGRGRRSPGKR